MRIVERDSVSTLIVYRMITAAFSINEMPNVALEINDIKGEYGTGATDASPTPTATNTTIVSVARSSVKNPS